MAAIMIQIAYRGHLVRRALSAARGLRRLKALSQGQSVKHKATSTLKSMQTFARVQSQRMWENSTKFANPTFLDSKNPHWGWSWLQRWIAARPWETQKITDKEPSVGETVKRVSRPPSRQCSPSTPPNRAPSSSSRVRPESQKGSIDDDSRSYYSVQSDQNMRHSHASSVRDDESLDSTDVVPNYMDSTKLVVARSRMASPTHSPSPLGSGRKDTLVKGSVAGSSKKWLLFSGSSARTTKRFTKTLMMDLNS